MAYPPSTHFLMRGTGPGSEIWQTGFWSLYQPTDESALGTALAVVKARMDTFWTAHKVHVYPTYAITEYRAYSYAGGSTKSQFEQAITFTGVPGTLSGNGSPVDTCLVASLRTNFVGRSRRGRMYLPFHEVCTSAGMIGTGDPTPTATAVAAMLSGVNADGFGNVAVVSQVLSTPEPVTSVVVDNKPDVQRRRENRISATLVKSAGVTTV